MRQLKIQRRNLCLTHFRTLCLTTKSRAHHLPPRVPTCALLASLSPSCGASRPLAPRHHLAGDGGVNAFCSSGLSVRRRRSGRREASGTHVSSGGFKPQVSFFLVETTNARRSTLVKFYRCLYRPALVPTSVTINVGTWHYARPRTSYVKVK